MLEIIRKAYFTLMSSVKVDESKNLQITDLIERKLKVKLGDIVRFEIHSPTRIYAFYRSGSSSVSCKPLQLKDYEISSIIKWSMAKKAGIRCR